MDKEKLFNLSTTQVTDESSPKVQINGILLSPELIFADLAPKICVVCGDKALSCNFGAITCESCKAFFRRNAHKFGRMKVKCVGTCDVSLENRSRCKRCRLQKCILKGMKKDLILSDAQKIERKRKIEINKQRKSGAVNDSAESSESPPSNEQAKEETNVASINSLNAEIIHPMKRKPSTLHLPPEAVDEALSNNEGPLSKTSVSKSFIHQSSNQDFSSEKYKDSKDGSCQTTTANVGDTSSENKLPMTYLNMQSFGSENGSPNESICSSEASPKSCITNDWSNTGYKSTSGMNSFAALNDCYASPVSLNGSGLPENINSQYKQATELNEGTSTFVPPFSCPLYGKCLTPETLAKMDPDNALIFSEMCSAFSCSFDQPLKKNVTNYPTSIGWINQCEIGVEVIVKMAKQLPSFSSFIQDDQIILLKGSILEMLICQSLRAFDDKNMRFVIPDCNLQAEGNCSTFSSPADILSKKTDKFHPEFVKMVTYYVDFFQMFIKASKGELSILMCVIVILLFSPRGNFTYKNYEAVVYWFHTYLKALANLIEVLYPDGDLKIDNVLKSLEIMTQISNAFQTTLKQVTPIDLSPLIAEMFDICI